LPSLKDAGFDAAAFRAAGFCWSDLKAAGFTFWEVPAARCDLASAQSAGYDVSSLIAGFGYDAVATLGCDMSSVVLVPLPPPLAKRTARADNRSASAGPQTLDLIPCNPRSPARRRQPLRDAAYAPS
jgi:hypothetical protein